MPYSVLNPQLNGVQVMEWGMHDPEFGLASKPASLVDQLCGHHGKHPVTSKAFGRCDRYPKTADGYNEWLNSRSVCVVVDCSPIGVGDQADGSRAVSRLVFAC